MKKKLIALTISATLSFASVADISSVTNALEADDVKIAEQAYAQLSVDEKESINGQILNGRILLKKEESEEAFDYFEELRGEHSENIDVNY